MTGIPGGLRIASQHRFRYNVTIEEIEKLLEEMHKADEMEEQSLPLLPGNEACPIMAQEEEIMAKVVLAEFTPVSRPALATSVIE